MKKLNISAVLLVFILITPFALVISESNKKPLLERVENEDYTKQPKDSLWEFVKHEFKHDRIDLKSNYNKQYNDPILIALKMQLQKIV